ncbi:MAG: CorA family divalent cation transporter [Novosphingobium sp.]
MRIVLYDAEGHDSETSLAELPGGEPGDTRLLWLNAELAELRAAKLPASLAEAVRAFDAGDTLVRLREDHYSFAVPSWRGNGEHADCRLAMLVGHNWLITLGDGAAPAFDNFVEQDTGETMKGRLTASTLAAALLSEHLVEIRRRLSAVDSEIDKLEDAILRDPDRRSALPVLAVLRRRVARLREVVAAHRPVIHTLVRPDFLPEVAAEDRTHFEHLADNFARLEGEIARARDTVVGSFELYATRVAQDTNRLLKALTVTTVITGMVAALAGVFGMNFKIPYFDTGVAGFTGVVVAMVALAGVLVALGLWRRWF